MDCSDSETQPMSKAGALNLKTASKTNFCAPKTQIRSFFHLFILLAFMATLLFTGQSLSSTDLILRNVLAQTFLFKLLCWLDHPGTPYSFFLWIGMDAEEFTAPSHPKSYQSKELKRAAIEITGGLSLLTIIQAISSILPDLLIAWGKLLGFVLIYYFGAFRLLACFWNYKGRGVHALMNKPLSSANLVEFWGLRWNQAFPYLMRRFIHYPLQGFVNERFSLVLTFLFSGFLHELVLSAPVKSGYGLPTLYFLIQSFGVLLVKSDLGTKMGLKRGWKAKAFTWAWLLVPLPLLFHSPFMMKIILII